MINPSSEFLRYWNLKKSPFSVATNPREELFISEQWLQVLKKVRLGETSFLHPIGCPAGHGKTSLASWLQQQKVTSSVEVLLLKIFNKQNRPGWILKSLSSYTSSPSNNPSFYQENQYKKLLNNALR